MKLQAVSAFAVILLAGLKGAPITQAAPFYYYFADDAPDAQAQAPDKAGQAQQAADQMQQAAGQAQDSVKDAAQQLQDKVSSGTGAPGETPIRNRISGHMTDLYTHGSSAVKGLVDTVQPDFKNIGKDLTDVYQQTRTEMGKKMEPLAQTVRPYIDHAQKVVAPYMSKAREEVPKAMSKVTNAVWSKIGGHQEGQTGAASEQVQHAANDIQKDAGEVAQQAASTVQQESKQ